MSTKWHYTDESTGAVITAPVDSSKVFTLLLLHGIPKNN
jgi:hypothetical protein